MKMKAVSSPKRRESVTPPSSVTRHKTWILNIIAVGPLNLTTQLFLTARHILTWGRKETNKPISYLCMCVTQWRRAQHSISRWTTLGRLAVCYIHVCSAIIKQACIYQSTRCKHTRRHDSSPTLSTVRNWDLLINYSFSCWSFSVSVFVANFYTFLLCCWPEYFQLFNE